MQLKHDPFCLVYAKRRLFIAIVKEFFIMMFSLSISVIIQNTEYNSYVMQNVAFSVLIY